MSQITHMDLILSLLIQVESTEIVFESPVRSGLLPLRGLDWDRDRSLIFEMLERPDWTTKDQSNLVGLGLLAVTRPVLTSYSLDWFFEVVYIQNNEIKYIKYTMLPCAGLHWTLLACRGPVMACICFCWPVLGLLGLHWPLLACVGLRWPELTCCELVLACIGLHWPALAHIYTST